LSGEWYDQEVKVGIASRHVCACLSERADIGGGDATASLSIVTCHASIDSYEKVCMELGLEVKKGPGLSSKKCEVLTSICARMDG
jgi:hypothetical protein